MYKNLDIVEFEKQVIINIYKSLKDDYKPVYVVSELPIFASKMFVNLDNQVIESPFDDDKSLYITNKKIIKEIFKLYIAYKNGEKVIVNKQTNTSITKIIMTDLLKYLLKTPIANGKINGNSDMINKSDITKNIDSFIVGIYNYEGDRIKKDLILLNEYLVLLRRLRRKIIFNNEPNMVKNYDNKIEETTKDLDNLLTFKNKKNNRKDKDIIKNDEQNEQDDSELQF